MFSLRAILRNFLMFPFLLFTANEFSAKRRHSGHFRPATAEVWDSRPQYEFTAFGRRFRLLLAHDTSFVSPNIKVKKYRSIFLDSIRTTRFPFDQLNYLVITLCLCIYSRYYRVCFCGEACIIFLLPTSQIDEALKIASSFVLELFISKFFRYANVRSEINNGDRVGIFENFFLLLLLDLSY